jgi:hypothetical protein
MKGEGVEFWLRDAVEGAEFFWGVLFRTEYRKWEMWRARERERERMCLCGGGERESAATATMTCKGRGDFSRILQFMSEV